MVGNEELKGVEFKHILIAEDNDSNYMLVSTLLKKKYTFERAANGVEAVKKAAGSNFDAILMDIKMPMMDGIEATKTIREFNTEIPIIALTAYAFDSDKEAAIAAGCNEYLTKPINRVQLFELLDKVIK